MSKIRNQFLTLNHFQSAWQRVAQNRGCAGVDGETIAHFARRKDQYLRQLIRAIADETYRPLPLRQIFIPKKEGGWRELRIPTVRDRIVQQALLQVLHPVMELEFEDASFAYRPGRSHLMAVRKVSQWRDRDYDWVLEADIQQYFDSILHSRLLAEIIERFDEPWVLKLIVSWVKVGVLTKEGLLLPSRGIPQGAVISPLLSNIYLDDFDQIITDSDLKLVRYGDDFVILSRHQKRIIEAREEVEQILESMDLDLHPEKTRITNFQQGFRFLGHVFVGDLAIPRQKLLEMPIPRKVKDDGLRLVHQEIPTNPTAMQQALMEALKAAQKPIPPPLFVLLGYAIRQEEKIAITSDELSWETGMATIYLVKQGTTVRKEQERFILQPPQESETEIPIQEVERILIFGSIQLTAAAISTCLERRIPVLFLTQMGEYKGHLWSAEATDLIVEMVQFQWWQDEAFKLAMAREIVQGKLENSRQLLLRLNRKGKLPEVVEAIQRLANYKEAVSLAENTATVEQIRGYEGVGAAAYFPALGKLIRNPGFSLTGRNFHPPKDPMNSLLSFGYTLLLNNVLSLLLAEGLNPYLGNLHGSERPKAYLAFDLMEEFRSPIVDTLVMKLVNQKVLKPTDFTYPNAEGGIYLEDTARRVFLKNFEARICEKTSHPDVQKSVSYRRIIQLQIKRYKKSLLENQPYTAFRRMN